ncbi:hypothetical protein HN51_022208 [Arachis hypogaea]
MVSTMPQDAVFEHPLFRVKLSSLFPLRFQDVSDIRQVPDHQEVFADATRDESLILGGNSSKLEGRPLSCRLSDKANNQSRQWFEDDDALERAINGEYVSN